MLKNFTTIGPAYGKKLDLAYHLMASNEFKELGESNWNEHREQLLASYLKNIVWSSHDYHHFGKQQSQPV